MDGVEVMRIASLLMWIFFGYIVGIAVHEGTSDPQLAVLAGCFTTSALQRTYMITGRMKRAKQN